MHNSILKLQSVWALLQNTDKPIILYGMGNGADKILEQFAQLNIACSGVMASDAFVRGQKFHGFTVERLADIECRYEDFIVAVAFASQRGEVIDTIKTIAQKHKTVVPCVPVVGHTICDDQFINTHSYAINRAYSLLSDEQSKAVFKDILSFYYTGDLSFLWDITTEKEEAFHRIIKLTQEETYLDLGAYKGDTIEEFLAYSGGGYKSIIAVEPDKKNFKKLEAYVNNKPNIELCHVGVWNETAQLPFAFSAGRNAAVDAHALETTPVTSVDDLVNGRGITYLKMDVEGAEEKVIEGAIKTIQHFMPKLNIAAYHTFEDLFYLPLQIHRIQSNYQFYLRHHPYIPAWDTNLYCVPRNDSEI